MPRRITHIINHWSVTEPFVRVADIRRMHLNKGWRDIGYHRVILHPDSAELASLKQRRPLQWWDLVKQGRHLDDDLYIDQSEVGAHTLGYNSNAVGICTIGHPTYSLHPLQRVAIIEANRVLCTRFQLNPAAAVRGHRDFNATQCPGDEIYNLLKTIRA